MLGAIQAGVSVLGGLKGLFGKKKKSPTPAQNLMSQAQGAREAGEKYGFNPLTLLQYGQTGGAISGGDGGTPPLASVEAIASGLQGFDDIFSGRKAQEQERGKAELELLKRQVETFNLDVAGLAPRVVDKMAGAPAPLGRKAVTQSTVGGTTFAEGSRLTMGQRPPRSPYAKAQDMIPVIYPDGVKTAIPRGVADRLGVQPFGTLIGSDIEDLKGEFVGNVETSARSADISGYVHSGKPAEPLGSLEYDPEGRKWVPPFTDPKSDSWWKRPAW